MQTILGAGGPVGNALAKALLQKNEEVRLASRREIKTSGRSTWMKADLKDAREVQAAVRGASVIYLCAGLKYDKKVWAEEWPVIIQHAIDGAKETGARLIFFDNVYMYGKVDGPMKEDTPYNPSSVKGEIRAGIATKLMKEAKTGNIKASIARAADFYGAESLNSFFDSTVLAKYAKQEKAMWLGDVARKHSFTYIPDAARALVLLGEHPDTDNQVWHMPTAPALTGEVLIRMAAEVFHAKPKYMSVSKFMISTLGIFNKMMAESAEMFYQYTSDYVFDSEKFENRFQIKPTAYQDGILEFARAQFKI